MVLPLWSTIVEEIRIRNFWSKLVRKRPVFTLTSPNFDIFPSYNAYLTLMIVPTTVEVQQICKPKNSVVAEVSQP